MRGGHRIIHEEVEMKKKERKRVNIARSDVLCSASRRMLEEMLLTRPASLQSKLASDTSSLTAGIRGEDAQTRHNSVNAGLRA
jgi:hypothetical protein